MSSTAVQKVSFKFILTSDRSQPYKVIAIPESVAMSVVVRFVANAFNLNAGTIALLNNSGSPIMPTLSAGEAFLQYGSDIRVISRDRVGAF
ncbi:hypothetical protein PCE1_000566 [Barthelona sp. PCE]